MKKVIILSIIALFWASAVIAQLPVNYSATKTEYYEKDIPSGTSQDVVSNNLIVVNPVEGFINIRSTGDTELCGVEIFSMDGKLALSAKAGGNHALIPAQTLPRGMYVMRINTEVSVITTTIYKA